MNDEIHPYPTSNLKKWADTKVAGCFHRPEDNEYQVACAAVSQWVGVPEYVRRHLMDFPGLIQAEFPNTSNGDLSLLWVHQQRIMKTELKVLDYIGSAVSRRFSEVFPFTLDEAHKIISRHDLALD